MYQETDRIEQTAQRPNVSLLCERAAHVEIHHLRGTIHLSGLLRYVLFGSSPLFSITRVHGGFDTGSEIAQANLTILRKENT